MKFKKYETYADHFTGRVPKLSFLEKKAACQSSFSTSEKAFFPEEHVESTKILLSQKI